MLPGADAQCPRPCDRIVPLGLGHRKSRIPEAEICAVAIARLWIAFTGSHRIAIKHGCKKSPLRMRGQFDANARRGEGKGNAAVRQICAQNRCPPESAANAQSVEGRLKKFRVGADLSSAHRQELAELLLQPNIRKACRGDTLKIGQRRHGTHKMAADADAVHLPEREMEGRAFPARRIFGVPLDRAKQSAVIG